MLTDDAETRGLIYHTIKKVLELRGGTGPQRHPHLPTPPRSATRHAGSDSDEEDADTSTCYDRLHTLQGRFIDLADRAKCAARMSRQFKRNGIVHEWPTLADLHTLGASKNSKRVRVSSNVAIAVGGEATEAIASMTDARERVRVLWDCVAAALGQQIRDDAYGGTGANTDPGWVNEPGVNRSVRCGITLYSTDYICKAQMRIPTECVKAYTRAVDKGVAEFFSEVPSRTRHPNEIARDLVNSRPALFVADEQVAGAKPAARKEEGGGRMPGGRVSAPLGYSTSGATTKTAP